MLYALRFMPYWAFGFERKIFLGQITKRNHDGRRNYFCNGRIQMEVFHEEPDKNIIQENADQHKQKIPEQLYPPL